MQAPKSQPVAANLLLAKSSVASPSLANISLAKISSPRCDRPFLRPRLFSRLDDLRLAALTWIAGPPGAGKTTLMSSYLVARRLPSLWYQLDADDADVATFFHYLRLAVAQATRHVPGASEALPSLTPEYLPGLMSFTRRYAEALSSCLQVPTVIVLDNYEQLPALAPLHDVLRELTASLPRGLTLVVLSRAAPPAAFARLQLNGDVVCIDAHELNLIHGEAVSLANLREADRSAGGAVGTSAAPSLAHVERLLVETQGWFAGFALRLAEGSASRENGTEAKTQQLLFDYFATEFFGRFDSPTQLALLRTAVLPSMTLAAAERMSGHAPIGALLTELHRQNCFVVQRGQTEPVYEYHALFRAFLLKRAATVLDAQSWRALQCRAAEILAESDQADAADAAAALYRAAQAWQPLGALALREAPALIAAGRHRVLEHWLAELPAEVFEPLPWLAYWRGMAALPFDPVAARTVFEHAYKSFQKRDDIAGLYSAWSGAMESFFYEWRDFTPADRWIAEFERLRARHPEFPSRTVERRTYWAMGTFLHRQPQHPLLAAWAERSLALLDAADGDLSILLGGYLVIWFLWRGETQKASSVIEQVSPWARPQSSPIVMILWHCAVGLFHSVQGETKPCGQAIDAGLALARRTGLHVFDFLLAAQMARGHLIAGSPAQAEPWIAAMGETMRTHSHIDGAFRAHLQSNAASQRGEWQASLDHARRAMDMAFGSGVPWLEAHCHIDLARALLERGDRRQWEPHIAAARSIGQTMRSAVVEYLCLEAEAVAAFGTGRRNDAMERLTRALAVSHAMGGATWRMLGAQASVPLYEHALGAGIEVGHVQHSIRQHRLAPADPATVSDRWPWPIRLYTLGRFEILLDDAPLRSSGKAQHKPLELLKCLCAFGGQAVAQDRVTDALWPDAEGDAADQALRTTLHRLRKLLGHDQVLRLEDRHLHLDPRLLWADCLAFDRAAHHPRTVDRASLELALGRYRGPFLNGESAFWAIAFRDRLRAHYMGMSERLGALLEADGDWPAAVDRYLRALEIEPMAEGFYRRLMHCYAQLGRRAEALAVYQRCRQTLLGRLGVSPTPATQSLYRELADG